VRIYEGMIGRQFPPALRPQSGHLADAIPEVWIQPCRLHVEEDEEEVIQSLFEEITRHRLPPM